jgi:hypothetical protein
MHAGNYWTPERVAARRAERLRADDNTRRLEAMITDSGRAYAVAAALNPEQAAEMADRRTAEHAKALERLWADPAATEAVRTLAASRHGLRTVEQAIMHLRGHALMPLTPP